MFEELDIPSTRETPLVKFDKEKAFFEMRGVSFPEDVRVFFGPILFWLNEYMEKPQAHTHFHFYLTYFNTASSKMILDMMLCLNKLHRQGASIEIVWHHDFEDDDMEECGEGFAGILQVPFRIQAQVVESSDEE